MPHPPTFVESFRQVELAAVADRFPPHSKVLELGAGAGWQARRLQELGHEVKALEFAHPGFHALRDLAVFPIEDYDGEHIPFPDASFDAVFSSNVLEHVWREQPLQSEIFRVLRPGGIAIHLVPSPAWRMWSWLSHYAFVAKHLFGKLTGGGRQGVAVAAGDESTARTTSDREPPAAAAGQPKGWQAKLAFFLLPERHGENGNFLTEVWHFSRWRWQRTFRRAGFSVLEIRPVGLFYTGYGVLGERLGLDTRKRLGPLLGRATTLYVVKKEATMTATDEGKA